MVAWAGKSLKGLGCWSETQADPRHACIVLLARGLKAPAKMPPRYDDDGRRPSTAYEARTARAWVPPIVEYVFSTLLAGETYGRAATGA
jgi:hypothetical protein